MVRNDHYPPVAREYRLTDAGLRPSLWKKTILGERNKKEKLFCAPMCQAYRQRWYQGLKFSPILNYLS